MPNHKQEKTMIGAAPNLARECEAHYDDIYARAEVYQQVWDEIKYPDEDFVKGNADEISGALCQLFYIADTSAVNRDEFVAQLSVVKDVLNKLRADYCERETEKRAYPKLNQRTKHARISRNTWWVS